MSASEGRMRKNILITGASSGLGLGMAREFARRGANLALCARRVEALESLRAELLAAHPGLAIAVRPLDVNDHDAVFRTFRAFRDDLGRLDRVVVNAGLGKGASLGTGYFAANRQTAETNFVAALAQCEAALEIFRAQGEGHLVTIASVAATRGMAGAQTVYAATKAGLSSLTEGIRLDVRRTRIRVSAIYPGFIDTPINAKVRNRPFLVDLDTGSRALVAAIEREPARAYVPAWPWAPVAFVLRHAPFALLARLS
jgi:short-subunit dehydrogenase